MKTLRCCLVRFLLTLCEYSQVGHGRRQVIVLRVCRSGIRVLVARHFGVLCDNRGRKRLDGIVDGRGRSGGCRGRLAVVHVVLARHLDLDRHRRCLGLRPRLLRCFLLPFWRQVPHAVGCDCLLLATLEPFVPSFHVLDDVDHRWPLGCLDGEDTAQQRPHRRCHRVERVEGGADAPFLAEQLKVFVLQSGFFPWEVGEQDGVEDDPERPDVLRLLQVVRGGGPPVDQLWGHVGSGAGRGAMPFGGRVPCETKVADLDVALVDQHVLRLEVAVNDVHRVEVLDADRQLHRETLRLAEVQSWAGGVELREEVTAVDQLELDEEVLRRFQAVERADNVGVHERFADEELGDWLLPGHERVVERHLLHSTHLPGRPVDCLVDGGEGAFAQALAKLEPLRRIRVLVRRSRRGLWGGELLDGVQHGMNEVERERKEERGWVVGGWWLVVGGWWWVEVLGCIGVWVWGVECGVWVCCWDVCCDRITEIIFRYSRQIAFRRLLHSNISTFSFFSLALSLILR